LEYWQWPKSKENAGLVMDKKNPDGLHQDFRIASRYIFANAMYLKRCDLIVVNFEHSINVLYGSSIKTFLFIFYLNFL
tara:strand:+ start:591 stop:824 length:234 start_codon:yes stop_codon:yes gene_type:complete